MQSLKEILNKIEEGNYLLGERAHEEMSPLPEGVRKSQYSKSNGRERIGAVMVLLYNKDNEPHFVVTQRHKYEGAHSGQISLPGGKYEESDSDNKETALRETEEEIGVSIQKITIVGSLNKIYIPPSNFLVYPYIGVSNDNLSFVKDEFEVKEIIEIPVAFLRDTKLVEKSFSELTNTSTYEGLCNCFVFEGHVIWGATAMILNELRYILLA